MAQPFATATVLKSGKEVNRYQAPSEERARAWADIEVKRSDVDHVEILRLDPDDDTYYAWRTVRAKPRATSEASC